MIAADAIAALADACFVVLGLDLRTYDEDRSVLEVPWNVFYGGTSANRASDAREAALAAPQRLDLPGTRVLATVEDWPLGNGRFAGDATQPIFGHRRLPG